MNIDKKIEKSPFLVDTSLEFVDPNITGTISQLPDDLVYEFSKRLSLNDLSALCQTSSRFNRLICGVQLPNQSMSERDQQRSKLFWIQILSRDYPETLDYLPIDTDPRKVLRFFDRSQKNQIKFTSKDPRVKYLIRPGDSIFFKVKQNRKIESEFLEKIINQKYIVTAIDPFSFYPKTRYIIMDSEEMEHELFGEPFVFDKIPIPDYLEFEVDSYQKTETNFIIVSYYPVQAKEDPVQVREDIKFDQRSENISDPLIFFKINENKYEVRKISDYPKLDDNRVFTLMYYDVKTVSFKSSTVYVYVYPDKTFTYDNSSGELYPETILQIKKDIDFVFLSHLPEINRNLLWLKTQPWIDLKNLSPEQMITELRRLGWL